MSKDKCYEGWSFKDGNNSGRCCCNCRNLKPISKHPWNKDEWARGSIKEIIGYGCMAPELEAITFSDRKHSMCELHERWDE